jgi:hypothetical protein
LFSRQLSAFIFEYIEEYSHWLKCISRLLSRRHAFLRRHAIVYRRRQIADDAIRHAATIIGDNTRYAQLPLLLRCAAADERFSRFR